MRKLAREAVIFMLLGPVVAGLGAFVYLERQIPVDARAQAARGVYAIDAALEKPRPPAGFVPDNSVLVPLTNGVQLYVTDCNKAHPIDLSAGLVPKIAPPSGVTLDLSRSIPLAAPIPIPPGATNGSDCVYFANDPFRKYGGYLTAVPLGDVNQIAIEAEYWQAYAKAKASTGWRTRWWRLF